MGARRGIALGESALPAASSLFFWCPSHDGRDEAHQEIKEDEHNDDDDQSVLLDLRLRSSFVFVFFCCRTELRR